MEERTIYPVVGRGKRRTGGPGEEFYDPLPNLLSEGTRPVLLVALPVGVPGQKEDQ